MDENELQDVLNWVRVYLLNELVLKRGETITADLTGDITAKVVELLKEKFG